MGFDPTEHEERDITLGDVVHIKAGEKHWHGARKDTTLSHITITTAGSRSRR
jgi:quercetin dioxygenase-like cupin family protein